MVLKKVSHIVNRPGRVDRKNEAEILVAEDLATVPGVPKREKDLSFYSRTEPLESQSISKTADRAWTWSVFSEEVAEYLTHHIDVTKPLVDIAEASANLPPTGEIDPSENITDVIRDKAIELGFGEVGFTRYDRRL